MTTSTVHKRFPSRKPSKHSFETHTEQREAHMTAWSLSDDSIEKLVDLPETGMGFQLVSASWRGESAVLIVLNAALAFDLSQVELLAGTDPAVILTNGIRVLNVMRQAGATIVGRPEPHSFNLLESRVSGHGIIPPAPAPTAITSSPISQPIRLLKNVTASANRVLSR